MHSEGTVNVLAGGAIALKDMKRVSSSKPLPPLSMRATGW